MTGVKQREPGVAREPAEKHELEAVIEEARRRARRRRIGIALSLLATAGLGAGIYVLAAGGGDDPGASSGPDPDAVVSAAAQATIAEPTNALTIATIGDQGQRYAFSGLIDVAGGSFDLRLDSAGEGIPRSPTRLVAKQGEEAVNDVVGNVRSQGPPGFSKVVKGDRTCWFSNPQPTNVAGGISIEEGGTLAASIVESLPAEIEGARSLGGGVYAVELQASVSRPKDVSRRDPDRTWGSRELLGQLAGPIRIGVQDGRIRSVNLVLDDYRPAWSPGRYVVPAADRVTDDGVELTATFGATERQLRLIRPGCAIET